MTKIMILIVYILTLSNYNKIKAQDVIWKIEINATDKKEINLWVPSNNQYNLPNSYFPSFIKECYIDKTTSKVIKDSKITFFGRSIECITSNNIVFSATTSCAYQSSNPKANLNSSTISISKETTFAIISFSCRVLP